LGCPPRLDDVFKKTHVRKATGEFVDERSRKTHLSIALFYCSFYYNMYYISDLIYIFE